MLNAYMKLRMFSVFAFIFSIKLPTPLKPFSLQHVYICICIIPPPPDACISENKYIFSIFQMDVHPFHPFLFPLLLLTSPIPPKNLPASEGK